MRLATRCTRYSVEVCLDPQTLKGYVGATVLEIAEDFKTDTYRAVYTVRFAEFVYVLHVFQKKSRRGIATSQADLELIKKRLLQAETHYRSWQREQAKEN